MLSAARKVLCLDWDKRSLRLVVARVGRGQVKLEDAHAVRIPSTVDPDDAKAFGEVIAGAMKRHRIRLRQVVVDVPRDKAVINRLALPPTPDHEVADAVRFQAAKELPFPVEEARLDYVPMAHDDAGLVTEVLIAAIRRDTLVRLQEVCAAAGLTPVRIGLRPYANLISVSQLPGVADKRVLLVDVSPGMTEIDVFANSSDGSSTLAFSRPANVVVPVADLNDDSRISAKSEEAESILNDVETSGAVNALLVEITRTLQAYRVTEMDAQVDEIIVAGATGIETELVQAISERFRLPTRVFDPSEALGVSAADAFKLRSFSAVLGLAWGMSRAGLLELDFLNPKRPTSPSEILRRRLRYAGMAVAAVVLVFLGVQVKNYLQLRGEINRLDALINPGSGELANEVRGLREIDVTTAEVNDWNFVANQAVWLDHLLTITNAAVEPGKQMLVTDLAFDENRAEISMKVACARWDVATDFVRNLNEFVIDGKHPYRARQGAFSEVSSGDPKFAGRVDVTIEIVPLKEHFAAEKSREAKRKNQIRNITG